MKIAIIGAGISGLLAAKALHDLGISNWVIYDRAPEHAGKTLGLHFLHDNCGLPLKPSSVHNLVLNSDPSIEPNILYAQKTGVPEHNSVKNLRAYQTVYDMVEAHRLLTRWFGHRIERKEFKDSSDVVVLAHSYDYVISTIPRHFVQRSIKCNFTIAGVKLNTVPGDVFALVSILPQSNLVVYNVNPDNDWYRFSNVFGQTSLEMKRSLASDPALIEIRKVVTTDATGDVLNKHVIFQGRWGKWRRGVLAHETYYETFGQFKEHSTKTFWITKG